MGVRLPAEYQEVEYLKVNPSYTQYIDTGITPKQNATRWEFEVKFDNITAPSTSIMGAGWTNGNLFNFRVSNNAFSAAFGDGFKDFGVQADISVAHKVVINSYLSRFAELDGVRVTGTGNPTYDEDKNIYLFARNRSGAVDYHCKATIYYSKISENGVLIQDLIPCYRKADNKTGMYDLVTKQFFVNQGTGEFLVGPDVIDSISPLMVAWRRALMMQSKPTIIIPLLYSCGLTTSYNVYYGNAKRACSTQDILVMAGETITITKPSSVDIGIYTWDENTKQVVFVGKWNESLSAYTPSTNEFYRITIRTNPEHDINNGEVSNIITAVKGTQKYIFV